MKKRNNLLIAGSLISLILYSSCDDILNTVPTDRISSEVFWKTENDAMTASNAVYRYLDGIQDLVRLDGATDILHGNIQFSDWAAIERGEYDSNMEYIQTVWTHTYKGIRAVNNFLENVQQVEVTDRSRLDILSAEVRVIRAYLYIKLVMLYGDVPLITNTLTSVEEGKEVNRDSVDEVWAFIVSELKAAATVLPETASETGRMTKGAAKALQARAWLFQGKWAEAEEAAKEVIDMNTYWIYPSYEKLFLYEGENNEEVILDKQYIKDSYSNNAFSFLTPFSLRNNGADYVPTKKLFDAYRMLNGKMIHEEGSGFTYETQYENRDPRLSYSLYIPGTELPNGEIYNSVPGSGTQDEVANTYLATSLGFNVRKYVNPEDYANPSNCGINIILIRYAEVLLTYVESKIEQNKIDDSVLSAINQLRTRQDVGLAPVESGLNQEKMREIVRNERLVELAFEGLRLFDCRRWRTAETLFPGQVNGIVYQAGDGEWKTVTIEGFIKVFNPEKHYLWLIPQKEIDLNSNLKQNPNW